MESAVCPITFEIMRDPVVAADGHTYEREALLRWLKGSNNSPATGAPLANRTIIPNYCVKMLIRELHQPHAREILWLYCSAGAKLQPTVWASATVHLLCL